MRKAAEIPEGKGERERARAFSLQALLLPHAGRQAAHTPVTKQAARSTEHTRNEQLIAERPVHGKEGTAAGGGGPPIRRARGRRQVVEVVSEQWLKRLSLAMPRLPVSVPPPTTTAVPAHNPAH